MPWLPSAEHKNIQFVPFVSGEYVSDSPATILAMRCHLIASPAATLAAAQPPSHFNLLQNPPAMFGCKAYLVVVVFDRCTKGRSKTKTANCEACVTRCACGERQEIFMAYMYACVCRCVTQFWMAMLRPTPESARTLVPW